MEKDLITKTEAAKRLGISSPAVTKLCRKKFEVALEDGKIDFNHPIVQEHLRWREGEAKAQEASNLCAEEDDKLPGGVTFEDIENMTIREVVMKHGSMQGFKLYIDSLRGMADWKNKELKFLLGRGKVIEINPLAETLFSLIDLSFKRIVSEFPGAMAPQLKAIVLSSSDRANIEMVELMEKELSQIIKGIKRKVTADLQSAKKKGKI